MEDGSVGIETAVGSAGGSYDGTYGVYTDEHFGGDIQNGQAGSIERNAHNGVGYKENTDLPASNIEKHSREGFNNNPWWAGLDEKFRQTASLYPDLNSMMGAHSEIRNALNKKFSEFSKSDYDLYKSTVDTFEGTPRSVADYQLDTNARTFQTPRGDYTLENNLSDEDLDRLKEIGFVSGLNNEQLQHMYDSFNHIAVEQINSKNAEHNDNVSVVERELVDKWGANDPARYQAKLRSIDNFMQGMAPQMSGYDVQTFKNAMMANVPAYMNPVVLNLLANLGEMMSENKSYGVNSRYMSPSEAKGRLDMFLKDREKMSIRTSWNHPMKDAITREYRELLKVANGG
jgi:hypothetical protein